MLLGDGPGGLKMPFLLWSLLHTYEISAVPTTLEMWLQSTRLSAHECGEPVIEENTFLCNPVGAEHTEGTVDRRNP